MHFESIANGHCANFEPTHPFADAFMTEFRFARAMQICSKGPPPTSSLSCLVLVVVCPLTVGIFQFLKQTLIDLLK